MTIGLISDTHSHLDPRVFTYFKDCDEIWHAGDIGDARLISELSSFKPVRAVFGNIDGRDLQVKFPEDLWFECEGLTIWMTHIAGAPPRYNPRVKKILASRVPDILICGHSHILRIKRDEKYNNMLYLNPGAAGNHGFHTVKTIVRFSIVMGKVQSMEVVELGKRGMVTDTERI